MFVPQKGPVFVLEPFDGQERPAVFLEATFTRSVRVWWSLLWRTVLSAGVVGSVLLLLATGAFGMTGAWISGGCFGLAVLVSGTVVTGNVLTRNHGGFRLALVVRHPHLS